MPAVQLSRLKRQIDMLAWHFTRPEEFNRSLHQLLDSYANHTYRPGPEAAFAHLSLPAYHVPAIVMTHLELALSRWAAENTSSALSLADTLWQDRVYEPRILAAHLLGVIPSAFADQVFERLLAWAVPSEEKAFLDALFFKGTAAIRRDHPQAWLEVVQDWLAHQQVPYQRLGLMAARALILDRDFQNLPALFNAVSAPMQAHPSTLQHELRLVLLAFSQRSPVETVYFLRQMIGLNPGADLVRLIRRCLPEFPASIQDRVRRILQSLPRRNTDT